jgi:hypothetical protein
MIDGTFRGWELECTAVGKKKAVSRPNFRFMKGRCCCDGVYTVNKDFAMKNQAKPWQYETRMAYVEELIIK